MRLNEIKTHPIEVLKLEMLAKGKSRKRVNNVLPCIGKMLRYAHEVELIESAGASEPDAAQCPGVLVSRAIGGQLGQFGTIRGPWRFRHFFMRPRAAFARSSTSWCTRAPWVVEPAIARPLVLAAEAQRWELVAQIAPSSRTDELGCSDPTRNAPRTCTYK
jgi:hypothetical protein